VTVLDQFADRRQPGRAGAAFPVPGHGEQPFT
jgi:hypothetical protein